MRFQITGSRSSQNYPEFILPPLITNVIWEKNAKVSRTYAGKQFLQRALVLQLFFTLAAAMTKADESAVPMRFFKGKLYNIIYKVCYII